MIDSLDGLRHDVVVGGHNDDTDVRDLRASGTHGGECLMTRGIEESDMTSVGKLHVVGAYMLRDASGLAGDYIGLADIVEKRCLAVVHVTHDGDYRRTADKLILRILLLIDGLDHLGRDILGFESELLGYDIDRFGVKTLVDAHHHSEAHTCAYDLIDRHIHERGKIVGGNELSQLQHAAFGCLQFVGLTFALGIDLFLLLAPFGRFLQTLVLVGQAGESLLDLPLNILLGHLRMRLRAMTLTVAPALAVAVALLLVLALSASVLSRLLGGLLYIDFFFSSDTLALLAVACGCRSSCGSTLALTTGGDTVVALLFFALTARTCRLVDSRQVDLADHIDIKCRTGVGAEHSIGF